MSRAERNYILLSLFFMASSGVILHFLIEDFQIKTEYGFRANPWLDEVKFIHNLFNFIFIFCVGKIFNGHIGPGIKLKKRKRRVTGFGIFISILVLGLSGTILLYSTNEQVMEYTKDSHWFMGLFLIGIFIIHQIYPYIFKEKK